MTKRGHQLHCGSNSVTADSTGYFLPVLTGKSKLIGYFLPGLSLQVGRLILQYVAKSTVGCHYFS
jgi:hypothetical protein